MPSKNINSHIIPQHHLKQFTNDAGCIFTYPDPDRHNDAQCIGKGGGKVVKNTAVKEGYYSLKIEQVLDKKFERRGSIIAQKILKKQSITLDERTFFVEYLTSFMYRVPATKESFQRIYPNILKEMGSIERFIEFRNQPDIDIIDDAEYFRLLNDPIMRDKTIVGAWESSIESEHQQIYKALLSREWGIAEVVGNDEYFITSDNPLYYSLTNGIADRNSQITFPLSKKMAVVFDGDTDFQGNLNISYYPASRFSHYQVDLINKRTAINSTYLYSPRRDLYVQSLLEHKGVNPGYIMRKI